MNLKVKLNNETPRKAIYNEGYSGFCGCASLLHTANSSATIDGKFEMLNKRIGSVRLESILL